MSEQQDQLERLRARQSLRRMLADETPGEIGARIKGCTCPPSYSLRPGDPECELHGVKRREPDKRERGR